MKLIKSIVAIALVAFSSVCFALDVSGHWWNPAESGWGVAIQQQRDTVFLQLYTYTKDGAPIWYVGSCKLDGDLCAVVLYEAKDGDPLPYYNKPTLVAAGQATFGFSSNDAATFSFKIGDGSAWTKNLVKIQF